LKASSFMALTLPAANTLSCAACTLSKSAVRTKHWSIVICGVCVASSANPFGKTPSRRTLLAAACVSIVASRVRFGS
jgi:hypothetical protein